MATIITRAGKGALLTNAELDANFTNLNDELATKTTTEQAAAAAPVQSVAGKTGAVTLGPSDVGAAAASHTHTKSQITDLSLAWSEITGKPASFTPSAHGHAIADVAGLQTALNGKAASSHTHPMSDITGLSLDWSAIQNKPSTYTPSAHGHTAADISNLSDATRTVGWRTASAAPANAGGGDFNAITTPGTHNILMYGTNANGPGTGEYYYVSVYEYDGTNLTQMLVPYTTGGVWYRYRYNGTWGAWKRLSENGHGHAISDVSGLQTALDGKSETSHTHSYLPLSGGTLSGMLYSASLNGAMEYGNNAASFEVRNSSGSTGDYGMAMINFHCQGAYAMKIGCRADGYFGIGGWSSAAWRWYSASDGTMVASGNVVAYSDPRLKEDFKRIERPMDILDKLDGGTFVWKHGIKHTEVKAGKRDYGVLADQVEAVMPEIVSGSIEIDGETYRTVAYEKLVPVLIEAIKELKAEVDALRTMVGAHG